MSNFDVIGDDAPTAIALAPWTDEQVGALARRQRAPLHPYTCERHSDTALTPTRDGWLCPECGYTQDWAHAADVSFEALP